jgi:CheY-like chemotaxis protein
MINRPINILLVEDDEVDVMNMKRAFSKNGITHPMYVAENGEVALHMLKYSDMPKPHIILLDLNMPRMGGIEFLEILRADPYFKDLSVFIITTSNEDVDKINAHKLNVSGYILKPLSGNEFVSKMDTLNSFWKLCEFPD